MAKYLIRFDDLYAGMEESVLQQLYDFIKKYKLPAILGVVPDWQDENDAKHPIATDTFWKIVKELEEIGCEITLHGYNHTLFEHPSLLQVNNYGEFAGLPKAEQKFRIREGKKVLEAHGLTCRCFMAPAHSFDENTLEALAEEGIEYITDGKSLFPYKERGVIFIPQISSNLKTYPLGLITICLHPQWMSSNDYDQLGQFINAQGRSLIAFDDAIAHYKQMTYFDQAIEFLARNTYSLLRKAKRTFRPPRLIY